MYSSYAVGLMEDGVKPSLIDSVCSGLKRKRELDGGDVVEVNMSKMSDFYSADVADLEKIVKWYESQLLSTKFKMI